ncbi:MAG: alpha/beta fold hydrolase [Alphaproteobacteria bacterium]|nr:alpha/beta fold hydrolase [Alphaproteobacteria bacterium]
MTFLKKSVSFLGAALLLLGACHSFQLPSEFQKGTIQTSSFRIFYFEKQAQKEDSSLPIKVYIEGDGHAYTPMGYPSYDPTPHSSFMRDLALKDPSPHVLYLARPCQFTKDSACNPKDWTTGRFSKKVLQSIKEALEQKTQNRPLILIGYSGGGAIACLLAVLYDDLSVKKIITLSGNLNHGLWTKTKKLLPLSDSLDVASYKKKLSSFPQHHYVGTKDKVIPPFLIQSVVLDSKNITYIKGAGHDSNFESIFPEIGALQ